MQIIRLNNENKVKLVVGSNGEAFIVIIDKGKASKV